MNIVQTILQDAHAVNHAGVDQLTTRVVCGKNLYTAATSDGLAINCPECLAKITERGYGVFVYDVGDRYWVAARSEAEAFTFIRSQPSPSRLVTEHGRQVASIDDVDMVHGDVEDGEEEEPCSLRDLLKWELEAGTAPPVIIASTDR